MIQIPFLRRYWDLELRTNLYSIFLYSILSYRNRLFRHYIVHNSLPQLVINVFNDNHIFCYQVLSHSKWHTELPTADNGQVHVRLVQSAVTQHVRRINQFKLKKNPNITDDTHDQPQPQPLPLKCIHIFVFIVFENFI